MPAPNLRGSDNLPFSPARDLAYLYAPACREAFRFLDEPNWPDYFRGWLEAVSVTQDDLAEGVKRFCEAHRYFVGDSSIHCATEAFERAKFYELPSPVRILIFEILGETLMGGFFVAMRDVTQQGGIPPMAPELTRMLAAGAALAQRLRQVNAPAAGPNTVDMPMDFDALVRESEQQLQMARIKLETQESRLLSALRVSEPAGQLARRYQPYFEYITRLEQQSWWRRGLSLLRLWCRGDIE